MGKEDSILQQQGKRDFIIVHCDKEQILHANPMEPNPCPRTRDFLFHIEDLMPFTNVRNDELPLLEVLVLKGEYEHSLLPSDEIIALGMPNIINILDAFKGPYP